MVNRKIMSQNVFFIEKFCFYKKKIKNFFSEKIANIIKKTKYIFEMKTSRSCIYLNSPID